ncbi:MAG: FecR family protein [Bacteroidetes bacterium]|nr:FecR family protein [Bacteroidota bacterium]
MNYNNTYNILVKYVDGEASAEEVIEIEKLIENDLFWKNEFEILKNINQTISNSQINKIEANTNQNWENLKKSIAAKPEIKINLLPRYLKYAAAAIVIFVAGWFLLNHYNKNNEYNHFATGKTYKTGINEMLEIILEDGSKITLNQNSELKIDKNYNISSRLTELKGEAYFEIAKQKTKPFFTKTNNTFVKVLGTKFKINSNSNKIVEISLYEGKVEFNSKNKSTLLTPGNMVKYTVNTNETEKIQINTSDEKFWENKLAFKDEKLKEIAKQLEKRFKISIVIPQERQDEKYTISFEGMSLESAIKLLEELTDSKITKNNSKYFVNP